MYLGFSQYINKSVGKWEKDEDFIVVLFIPRKYFFCILFRTWCLVHECIRVAASREREREDSEEMS